MDSIAALLQQLNWSTLEGNKNIRLTLLFKVIKNILIIPTEYIHYKLLSSSIIRAQHTLKFMHYQTSLDNY